MKFHWFAQQSYTKLPPDYRTSTRSAWVTPPISAAEPRQMGEDYRMYLRLMQHADQMGWDSLLLNEHHQCSTAMSPSPNVLASALAATTERAAIALCGNSLALYNPPIRVAEELAMLDCMSGGRLIAGFVLGTPMDTTFSYGMPPAELRERFEEARQLILRAWTDSEPFSFNGRFNKLRYVNIWPRPIQSPVPIWVPGSGSVETWDLVNRHDYCYGYVSYRGRQFAKPIVNGFWEHADRNGADMNPNRMAFTQLICCAETDADAEKLYSGSVKYFYRNNPTAVEFATPPGYNTEPSLRASLERAAEQSRDELRKASRGELDFWEYDDLGYIIAGSPERVEQKLRDLVLELRVGQLITSMCIGDMPEEVGVMNNAIFAERVAPKLRNIYSEYEDRWNPVLSPLGDLAKGSMAAAAP